jgi:hypothetical protein
MEPLVQIPYGDAPYLALSHLRVENCGFKIEIGGTVEGQPTNRT